MNYTEDTTVFLLEYELLYQRERENRAVNSDQKILPVSGRTFWPHAFSWNQFVLPKYVPRKANMLLAKQVLNAV